MKTWQGIFGSAYAAPGMPMPPPPPPGGMPPPPGGMPPPPMPAPAKQKSGAGTGAAIMYILGAILLLVNLAWGALLASALGAAGDAGALPKEAKDAVGYIWGVCVILPLIGMIFGFLGTVFIFQRKKFNIAMVGGILGLVAGILSGLIFIGGIMLPNMIGLLAFIFFMIGVILLFVAKKDFS